MGQPLPGTQSPLGSSSAALRPRSRHIKKKRNAAEKANKPEEDLDLQIYKYMDKKGQRAMQVQKAHRQKNAIVITCRVHPGETNSSFVMEGILDFLLSDAPEARNLRKNFVFKVIPMLNPDGVIYGNYRSSLLGVDLNRRWKNPSPLLHPTIHSTKQLIKALHAEREVTLYVDIHGHSSKKNIFMYGCHYYGSEGATQKYNNLIRMLPYLLSQHCKTFSYKECRFQIEREKETTARIVLFKELGIVKSYTLEATFFGCEEFKESSYANLRPADARRRVGATLPHTSSQQQFQTTATSTHANGEASSSSASGAGNGGGTVEKEKKSSAKASSKRDGIHICEKDLREVGRDFLYNIAQILNSKVLRRKFLNEE